MKNQIQQQQVDKEEQNIQQETQRHFLSFVFFLIGFISIFQMFWIDKEILKICLQQTQDLLSQIEKDQQNDELDVSSIKEQKNRIESFIFQGSEMKCVSLNNAYISQNTLRGYEIQFVEKFIEIPQVFMSITGFEFQPSNIIQSGQSVYFHFVIKKIQKSQFTIDVQIETQNGLYIDDSDFKWIDLCYFAFLKDESY